MFFCVFFLKKLEQILMAKGKRSIDLITGAVGKWAKVQRIERTEKRGLWNFV